jgi:general secretion pathway protein J
MIDAVVRVEERTAGRLDRLGQLQRTMFVLSRDLEQMTAGSLEQVEGGVRFQRQASSIYEPPRTIGYALRGDSLFRAAGSDQLLVDRVSGVSWSFFFPGRGWQPALPPSDPARVEHPAAVAVDILFEGTSSPSGALRRVVELPTPPAPPAQPTPPGLPQSPTPGAGQ